MDSDMICGKCQEKLVQAEISFSYMKHIFSAEVPRCPVCGQVFISEDLVKGRIAQVEMELEDK